MQFDGSMGDLDAYYSERRTLQVRNGKLHAEIWRLGKQPGTDDRIFHMGKELDANTIRIRTLNCLIDKKRLECLGLPTA